MKWKVNFKDGDRRIITKFLWVPVTVEGETRWLEKASIKQKFYNGGSWTMWWNEAWALSPLDEKIKEWNEQYPTRQIL